MSHSPILTITDPNPPPFSLGMSDDALVMLGAPVGAGAVSFTDVGYMPVNALTIAGVPQQPQGKFDGLYIEYSATGVQHFAPSGAPTIADYASLHFELVGYKGDAVFGHAADGAPTVSGGKHFAVLAQGDLEAGRLVFDPTGGISGEVTASYQVDGRVVGTLDLSVHHAATDIHFNSTGFTLSDGNLQATFVPLNAA